MKQKGTGGSFESLLFRDLKTFYAYTCFAKYAHKKVTVIVKELPEDHFRSQGGEGGSRVTPKLIMGDWKKTKLRLNMHEYDPA